MVNGNQCPRLDVSSNQFVKAVAQTLGALVVVVVRHKSQPIYTAFVCMSVIYSHASHVPPVFTVKIGEGQMGGEKIFSSSSTASCHILYSYLHKELIPISPASLNFWDYIK